MALLQWKKQYSVGIEAVDHEHRELIDLINRLHDDLVASGGTAAVEPFFGDLYAAISAHFALEERFMRENRYDQLAQHKADHEKLLDELRNLMDDFAARGTTAELSGALERWFAQHFETHDERLHKMLGAHPH